MSQNDRHDPRTVSRRDSPPRESKGLHAYQDDYDDMPKPPLKDTAVELAVTLVATALVFFLIIVCVKLWG